MTPADHTNTGKHRSSADYIDRTIATVRNHRDADNCWPQWANIFADEIEDLRADVDARQTQAETAEKEIEAAYQRGYDEGYATATEVYIEARE